MEGCFSRSDTVFASHYLRDVALEDVRPMSWLIELSSVDHPRLEGSHVVRISLVGQF